MFVEQKKLRSDLHIFLGIIVALTIIGFLFIYSASSVFALEKFGSALYFVKKQFIGLTLGLIGMLICFYLPLTFVKKMTPLFFFCSVTITALTMIPQFALHIHGSNRWLDLGFLVFQPSELLKVALILYVAYFLDKRSHTQSKSFKAYAPLLLCILVSCFLLLRQPDFGMTVTLGLTIFLLLFIMRINTKYLFIGALAAIPVGTALIFFRAYRLKRILTFFDPWSDPTGAGFQIIQSLIAIGSGSWWGIGVSHSKQKFFYLPMQHTDFIFSIIAEETGFVGSLLLVLLYFLLLYIGMRLAWRMNTPYSILVTLGFVLLTSLQAVINLAVTTGLVPTKGIGLPFVSYGNSALICSLCMIGIIMNCVYETRTY